MHSASGGTRRRLLPGLRSRTSVLLAAALLGLSLVGCTADAPPQGAPSDTVDTSSSSPGTVAPTLPQEADPTTESGTPTPTPGVPEDEEDDQPDEAPQDEGDDGSGTGGTSSFDGAATDDWTAPEDPTAEGPTAAPIVPESAGAIGEALSLPTDIVVDLTSITTTSLTAQTPGEYTGEAVVVEVRITNGADIAQVLDAPVVSLVAEDGEMGIATGAAPYDPLRGEVPPGATASGTYVFMLDPADGRSVTVRVNYAAGGPVATFTGTTP